LFHIGLYLYISPLLGRRKFIKDEKRIREEIEESFFNDEINTPPEVSGSPKKMGFLLPVGMAAVSLLTIILVPLFVGRAAATERAILELETESYYTTEWELLREYRSDAERRLDEKDAEIRRIREHLEELARERSRMEPGGVSAESSEAQEELLRRQRSLEAELNEVYREREQLAQMLENREREIIERIKGDAETDEQVESARQRLAVIERTQAEIDWLLPHTESFSRRIARDLEKGDLQEAERGIEEFLAFLSEAKDFDSSRARQLAESDRELASALLTRLENHRLEVRELKNRLFKAEQAQKRLETEKPLPALEAVKSEPPLSDETEEGYASAYDKGFAAGRVEGSADMARTVRNLLDSLIESYTVGGIDPLSTEEVFESGLLSSSRTVDARIRRLMADIEKDLEEFASKVRRETEYTAGLASPLQMRGIVTMVTLDRIYIEPLGDSSFQIGQEVLVGRGENGGEPRILARVSILESEGRRHEAEITRLFEGGGFPTESDKVYVRE
jgi:hypothetical protein